MRLVADLGAIGRTAWDGLQRADPAATIFTGYDYLQALHGSGCASEDTGWAPRLLTLWHDDGGGGERLAAAAPLYLKSHSYGEYVVDWAWAEAHQRQGLRYYPKWLSAVPFTPVPGSRLLAADAPARAALAGALASLARGTEVSSMHVLLLPEDQARALGEHGLLLRRGVQFHWQNAGYADFGQFLAALAQPKRKKVRAERRKVAEAGLAVHRLCGADITAADWRFFHRCYANTYAEHGATPYLSLAFFLALAQALPEQLVLVKAMRGRRPLACALAVVDARAGALYGRYWGAVETVSCLHFECCYYQMIEFAIERGLATFEGGAQGAHKLARGLDPVPTWSAHWVADPALRAAIARAVQREDQHMELVMDELQERRALKTPPAP